MMVLFFFPLCYMVICDIVYGCSETTCDAMMIVKERSVSE